MRYVRLVILGALAFLPAFAQDSSASFLEKNSLQQKLAPRQFGPIRGKTDNGDGTSKSDNWSGYAVLGSSFTAALGSWVVPTATCTGVSGDQYTAIWVGIDGYSSETVEQTGTDSDCVGTRPNYYVWYEFYPNPSYEVTSVPVKPGDVIYAYISFDAYYNEFTVSLTDETTGASFGKSATVSAADRSSAEWIVEAPCCTNSGEILPLSDFGTVSLGGYYTGFMYTNWAEDVSTSAAISGFPSHDVMRIKKKSSSGSPQTSTCSELASGGASFTCTWAK